MFGYGKCASATSIIRGLVAFIVASIFLAGTSSGASFKFAYSKEGASSIWHRDNEPSIIIIGEIKRDDYRKFVLAVTSAPQPPTEVWLNSPGGDFFEAIKIAKAVRYLGMTTHAPDTLFSGAALCSKNVGEPCQCASSCALIWSAGVLRDGQMVEFHRPFLGPEARNGLDFEEYANLSKFLYKEYRNLLLEFGVPLAFVEESLRSNSRELIRIPEKLAASLYRDPSFEEYVLSSCSDLLDAVLYRRLLDLAYRDMRTNPDNPDYYGKSSSGSYRPLSVEERSNLNELSEKSKRGSECARDLRFKLAKDRIISLR